MLEAMRGILIKLPAVVLTLKISGGCNQRLSSVIFDPARCILMLDLSAIKSSGIKKAASIADQ
jgi:hypothetical protein